MEVEYIFLCIRMFKEASKQNVDLEEAEKKIKLEWDYVQKNNNVVFLDPKIYYEEKKLIQSILRGNQLTYKYFLITAALSKVVNPKIHYRALQKNSELKGAYDARSVAHKIIVPFEKSHGERLGGSNEPFLNRPARWPEIDLGNRDRDRAALQKIFQLLDKSQSYSEKSTEYALSFLREVLREMSLLPVLRVDFHPAPIKNSINSTTKMITEFLSTSGSGERLVAVSAALFDSINITYDSKMKIKVYPVNWSDRFSKTAGDIEFYYDDKLIKASEVKDKPINKSDVMHCSAKAKNWKITEYIILYGAGIVEGDKDSIYEFLEAQLKEGINIYLLSVPNGYIPFMIYLGEEGRKIFLEKIGYYLNLIKAGAENKTSWDVLLK